MCLSPKRGSTKGIYLPRPKEHARHGRNNAPVNVSVAAVLQSVVMHTRRCSILYSKIVGGEISLLYDRRRMDLDYIRRIAEGIKKERADISKGMIETLKKNNVESRG